MLSHYHILTGPIARPPFLAESVLKIACVPMAAAFLTAVHPIHAQPSGKFRSLGRCKIPGGGSC